VVACANHISCSCQHFDGTVVINSNAHLAQHTFLGLNLFFEILFFLSLVSSGIWY
jgi:hypothetical protein